MDSFFFLLKKQTTHRKEEQSFVGVPESMVRNKLQIMSSFWQRPGQKVWWWWLGVKNQGHFLSTHCFPPSSYSCLDIHICWKVPWYAGETHSLNTARFKQEAEIFIQIYTQDSSQTKCMSEQGFLLLKLQINAIPYITLCNTQQMKYRMSLWMQMSVTHCSCTDLMSPLGSRFSFAICA